MATSSASADRACWGRDGRRASLHAHHASCRSICSTARDARARARALPGVARRGRTMPALELTLRTVAIEPRASRRLPRGLRLRRGETLPPTYPHILAFPLHMALMAESRVPVRRRRAGASRERDHAAAAARRRRAAELRGARDARPSPTRAGAPSRSSRRRARGRSSCGSEHSTMLRRERAAGERPGERGAAEAGRRHRRSHTSPRR